MFPAAVLGNLFHGAPYDAPTPTQADTFEPLVLWEAGPEEDDHRISVDPRLCKWLRPHQREGVQFMFECGEGGGRHCFVEFWV